VSGNLQGFLVSLLIRIRAALIVSTSRMSSPTAPLDGGIKFQFISDGILWRVLALCTLIFLQPSFRTLPRWLSTSRNTCKFSIIPSTECLTINQFSTLLASRLAELSPSTPYGTMPVHASLWESASVTADSLRSRLAIIHLVHEARGLDVNPATIEKFRKAGDKESVKVMEVIHADEVTHVTSGHRWFTWVCEQEGNVDPVEAFREEVRKGWRGDVKGPFNVEDREKAGMTREFYEDLKGEMGMGEKGTNVGGKDGFDMKPIRDAVAAVPVEYETEK
jgi:hypothetical protein